MTDHVETSLPALIFTASVPGNAPGQPRLLIDNDDATNDQRWLVWGIETNEHYTFTDSTGNGGLFYEAESRTALGGSATAAGPSGASGAGSNVMRNTALSASFQAILSTQATGGGAHLGHVGTFRVFARVQVPATNTGTVSVALEWGDGDFRRFTGPPHMPIKVIDPTWEGSWQILNLGLVAPQKAIAGTQRWEGRIVAKSTVVGDDIDIDWLMLVPADEGYGEVSVTPRINTPGTFSARDEFDQAVGALATKTLPVGGTWSGAGDTDDLSIVSGAVAQRTAVSDTAPRVERAGSGTLTDAAVQADVTGINLDVHVGVFARYVDASNYLEAHLAQTVTGLTEGPLYVVVRKRIAGTFTDLGVVEVVPEVNVPDITWATLLLTVDAGGHWAAWWARQGSTPTIAMQGQDSALATGGTLATGGYGLYDYMPAAGAATRQYDNFKAWAYVADAVAFASQSAEARHDRFVREDSSGTLWVDKTIIGGYLRLPVAGAEGRTLRVIVKMSRGVPGASPDPGTDDISAKLFVKSRWLT